MATATATATATAGGAMASSSEAQEDWADLVPLFCEEVAFDEAAAVAGHERQRQREERRREKAAKLEKTYRGVMARIYEYDPKHKAFFFTRINFAIDLYTFDHDEESPLGPMRETDASIYVVSGVICKERPKPLLSSESGVICKERPKLLLSSESATILPSGGEMLFKAPAPREEFIPCHSVNVLSLKIVSSDVGFPIDVYGTVIARDYIDLKCVYLFRRDRDHCQLISTKYEPLIVTGPKRGLALSDSVHFEVDLKIKGVRRQMDRQLSKGFLTLDGIPKVYQDKIKVESICLNTRLSKVAIKYAIVKNAVEATFAAEVVKGSFYGKITACTSSFLDRRFYGKNTACTTSFVDSVVLYDTKLAEGIDGNGKGVIQLLRRVVAVGITEKLIVTFAARAAHGETKIMATEFTPRVCGGDEKEISFASVKMRVKVTWSIIDREYAFVPVP